MVGVLTVPGTQAETEVTLAGLALRMKPVEVYGLFGNSETDKEGRWIYHSKRGELTLRWVVPMAGATNESDRELYSILATGDWPFG